MSFEEKLGNKAQESKYLSISDLPTSIVGIVANEPQFKTDKRGNEAVYITIQTDAGSVVQKYGKSLYEQLLKTIKQCGGLEQLKTIKHEWKQEKAGRAQFNRYFPQPNKQKTK